MATSSSDARPEPVPPRWSLRRRLGLLTGGGATILAIASGVSADLIMERRLRRDYDAGLLEKAHVIATLTEQEGEALEFEAVGDALPEFRRADKPEYFEIWHAGGETFERSPSLGDRHLTRADAPALRPLLKNRRLPDGREGRTIQLDFEPRLVIRGPDGAEHSVGADQVPAGTRRHSMTLVLARDLAELRIAVTRVRAVLGGAAIAFVVGLIAVVRWAISRSLRPLQRLAERVDRLEPDALDGHFSSPDLPTEIVPLASRLDDLLRRLREAIDRERLFSSNVAHELRTPVAELRSLAEVASRWPGDREAIRGFFTDVETVAGQMEGLIANLLALARSEAGAETLQPEEAVLEDLTRAVWDRLRARAQARALSLDLTARGTARVVTDVAKLRLILTNLLGNAVDHAPPGSTVGCEVRVDDPTFQVSVSNPAPGLEREDLTRLFDRFWRKDEARGGHNAGLGLTLVRSLCGSLGYRVEPHLSAEGHLAIQVTGPRVVSA